MSDQLGSYDPHAFPPVAVTVDIVVLTIRQGQLQVVLIERGQEPFAGALALPGGFVQPDETLEAAAVRELAEETGVADAGHLDQFGAYGDPGRDPRMRVVSVGFVAIVRDVPELVGATDARRAELVAVQDVIGELAHTTLAFDHAQILSDGVEFAKRKLASTSLATAFVGPEFTMADLRRVYEAAWNVEIDPGNFRRKVLASEGFVRSAGRSLRNVTSGRPAEMFVAGSPEPVELHPPLTIERSEGDVGRHHPVRAPDLAAPSAFARARGAAAERSPPIMFAFRAPSSAAPAVGSTGNPAVWRIRAWDDAALQQAMLDRAVVAIGAEEAPYDVTTVDDRELAKRLDFAFRDRGDAREPVAISRFLSYWRSFIDEMRVDDYVLVPLAGRRVAIGRVRGEYRFDPTDGESRLWHTRAVEWFATMSRDALDSDLRKRVDAPGTIGRVRLADAAARVDAVLR